jgi:ribosomal protein S6
MTEKIMDEIRIYEAGYLLPASLSEQEAHDEASSIKSLIGSKEGVFISEETPRIKSLAYSIKSPHGSREHLTQAYFGWVKFEFPQSSITGLEKELKANKNVVRLLLVETVRENTLISLRTPTAKRGEDGKQETANEEIEKSIEKLVADSAV